jgi:hypothetical protein
MADAPDSQRDAEFLVLVCDAWLRLLARDGEPVPGPAVRAGLVRAADGAPRLAACCPALMRAIGPSAAYRVKAQAIALAVSEEARAAAEGARWISTAQAAAALGISAHGVRDLLRRGRLDGRRRECGWRVDAASVRSRRRDDRRLAAVH